MSKKTAPLVSLIMPVYNGSLFIEQAIESILNQTYQNFELIIINDFSTDDTPTIVGKYPKLYPKKVKVLHLKKNHGAYEAINKGFRQAKGEFIALMDSDDISHSKRLEKQVEFLLKNKKVIVVGTQARVINQNGKVIGEKSFPTSHKEIYKNFIEVFPLVHPSCMIRRSLLPQKNKLYKNKFGVNDDYFTFFSLLNHGKFRNLPEYFLDYRIHGGNSSLINLKEKFYNTLRIRLLAIAKLNYQPSLTGLTKFFFQIILVALLPESILIKVYLLAKGIEDPLEPRNAFTNKFNLVFGKAKNISFSLLSTR